MFNYYKYRAEICLILYFKLVCHIVCLLAAPSNLYIVYFQPNIINYNITFDYEQPELLMYQLALVLAV